MVVKLVKWWVGLEGSLKVKTVSFRVFVVVGGRGMKHGEMVKSRKFIGGAREENNLWE